MASVAVALVVVVGAVAEPWPAVASQRDGLEQRAIVGKCLELELPPASVVRLGHVVHESVASWSCVIKSVERKNAV